ncbi:hypothetical protein DL96DRAFT_1609827 [Flagelloscypha sp. PMI_526]|nr:hypothetical protein DL96DRAFT_1609827 [Flagelloscypha sp. PMI_526]
MRKSANDRPFYSKLPSLVMALPLDLIPVICLLCDRSSLTLVCLGSKGFWSNAGVFLYCRISFDSPTGVDHFLHHADQYLYLVKSLTIYIPSFFPEKMGAWTRLLTAVLHKIKLVSLKILASPIAGTVGKDFKALVCNLLEMPFLEYVAVTTMVVPAARATRCLTLAELHIAADGWASVGDLLSKDSTSYPECAKPKLRTFSHAWYDISLHLLQSRFSLRGLTRLAVNHKNRASLGPMIQLLAETCSKLQEFALWMSGMPDNDIHKIRVSSRGNGRLTGSCEDASVQKKKVVDWGRGPVVSMGKLTYGTFEHGKGPKGMRAQIENMPRGIMILKSVGSTQPKAQPLKLRDIDKSLEAAPWPGFTFQS